MADCLHPGLDPRVTCPHVAPGDSNRCVWHNPNVAKHDLYVAALFVQADSTGAGHFAGTHLVGLRIPDHDLHGRDFSGADLRDAVLDGCDLTGCDFTGAILRRTSLRHARLRGAKLAGADLTGAALAGADLREADVTGAVISGTGLLGADLRGADLTGAHIADFHWNRLTRFAGVRGLATGHEPTHGDDTTQVFPVGSALGDLDLDTPARLAFDRDPGLDRTRTWTAPLIVSTSSVPAVGAVSTVKMPQLVQAAGWRTWVVPALAGAAILGAAWATTAGLRQRTVATAVPDLAEHMQAAEHQHAADMAALAAATEAHASARAEAARLGQRLSGAQADIETLRNLMGEREHDLSRLSGADDRAAMAELRAQDLEGLAGDLARQSSRQDRIARVLADGLARHQEEGARSGEELTRLRAGATQAEHATAEAERLQLEMLALRQERDQLQTLHLGARDELAAAKRDMARWLARIESSGLQAAMADDRADTPLLVIKPGSPLALGGEFLVSLVVDRTKIGNQIGVQLVVQRPAAAANPDATVILYDQERRPLRRLSFSFPHVDAGGPFVHASSTLACDRFPAFARVILAPGDETLAKR